jgi:hypothetical protein
MMIPTIVTLEAIRRAGYIVLEYMFKLYYGRIYSSSPFICDVKCDEGAKETTGLKGGDN